MPDGADAIVTPRCMMGFHAQLFVLYDALAENMTLKPPGTYDTCPRAQERRTHQNPPKNYKPTGRRRRSERQSKNLKTIPVPVGHSVKYAQN